MSALRYDWRYEGEYSQRERSRLGLAMRVGGWVARDEDRRGKRGKREHAHSRNSSVVRTTRS